MSLLHEKCSDSVHTGLDLFSLPPTQTGVQDGMWMEYHPLATLAPAAPFELTISSTTEDYLDLSNTLLHLRAKITNADGNGVISWEDKLP